MNPVILTPIDTDEIDPEEMSALTEISFEPFTAMLRPLKTIVPFVLILAPSVKRMFPSKR